MSVTVNIGALVKRLTRQSAKLPLVGPNPTSASNTPNPLPKMAGGSYVPKFNINIKVCGYCGKDLVWDSRVHNTYGEFGPPNTKYEEITYGCPSYGDKGLHYFWWDRDAIYRQIKGYLTNAEAQVTIEHR